MERHRRLFTGTAVVLALVCALATIACSSSTPNESRKLPSLDQAKVAGTLIELDLPDAIAGADVIVLGSASRDLPGRRGLRIDNEARERLRNEGRTDEEISRQADEFADWVYTPSVFEVERVLKGEVGTGTIEIRNIGGNVDGYSFEADEDFPRLAVGKRQVVFLGRAWDGAYEPLAVYRVTGGMASTTDQGRRDNMPLEELINAVATHKDDPSPFPAAK